MYFFPYFYTSIYVYPYISFPLSASWCAQFRRGNVKEPWTALLCFYHVTFPLILRIKLNGTLQQTYNRMFKKIVKSN